MSKTRASDGGLPDIPVRSSAFTDLLPSLVLSPAQQAAFAKAIVLKKQALIFEEQGLKLKARRLRNESDALVNNQVDSILALLKSSAERDVS